MPKVIDDYLDGVMSMNAEQLPVAIALYQQATRFNRGNRMDINHRGLDDKTVMAFETLLNVRDVLGDEGLPEFMNSFRLKDKATSEEIKANINSKLGKEDGSNYKRNVREFVTNNIMMMHQKMRYSFTHGLLMICFTAWMQLLFKEY